MFKESLNFEIFLAISFSTSLGNLQGIFLFLKYIIVLNLQRKKTTLTGSLGARYRYFERLKLAIPE